MKYTCINIQGNLISEEILQKIEQAEAQGQLATDFGLEPGSNIRSEIEYAWSRIKLDWKHFNDKSQNLPASDPYGTTLSRKWMEQFLSSLGFDLSRSKSGLLGDNNHSYTISHTAENLDHLPIHIVGFSEPSNPDKNTLDIKTSGGTSKFSPHGTMQEYLNVTENIYGIATNGLFLRLIRDSGRLIKLTYVEFDIKRMMDEDKYSEFTLLYRLLHASRFPRNKAEADQCLLEKYYQDSIETGNRIRDGLSLAVKESLVALGKGFLQHEHNTTLREKIQAGTFSSKDYYRQLLRIIYRFLFLMVTEERDLVYDPEDKSEATQRLKKFYLQFYSIARLRKLSESHYVYEAQFNDLWQGLVNTFILFEAGGRGKKLGIQPLDGDLFSSQAIPDLEGSLINNKLLLECVKNLNEFKDENKNLVAINYRSLDVEELGSVYEGLLELHPVIENIEANNPAHINFTFHEGTDRKTTGSYYTRPELVNELIKSALIPVIEERLGEAQQVANSEWQMVSSELRIANGVSENIKNLIINLGIEYDKLSGITNLAKRNGFSGDDLPINKLLSQRRIVWDDFTTPKSSVFGTSKYSRGLGPQQQQGIQQLPENSKRKFEGSGNSFDVSSSDKTLQAGTNSTNAGNFNDIGQANSLLSKIHLSEKNLKDIWTNLPLSTRHSLLATHHLLKLKVCDAAAGSGHMLLAAARTIAWYLARVQSGEENPAPSVYRKCLREVIQHCIYAVDYNPDAVELCKLALWLEGHNSGKPLSFLDHKIRNGNSLVGVTDLNVLQKGIPDDAFNPVTGDDKKLCQELKKENAKYNKTKQATLDFDQTSKIDTTAFTGDYKELENIQQDDVEGVKQVKTKFEKFRNNHTWFKDWRACNLWTAAFFWNYTEENKQAAPNSERLAKFMNNPAAAYGPMVGKSDSLSMEHKFFHWPLEFPDVYEQGGFDVILGNPPWEIIELSVKEFFVSSRIDIVKAESEKVRKQLIDNLEYEAPALYKSFINAKHTTDSQRKFIQSSNRFPNGASGRIDLYPLFIENSIRLISKNGMIGMIVPSDISTGAYNVPLFSQIINEKRLNTYYDFINIKGIFQGVHRSKRFCLLTLNGPEFPTKEISFIYLAKEVSDLQNSEKRIKLNFELLSLFSPNTLSPPIFLNSKDLELSKRVYKANGVFIDKFNKINKWDAYINRMFSISDAGVDFRKNFELSANDKNERIRILGGKNIYQFNHRYQTSIGRKNIDTTLEQMKDSGFVVETETYAPISELLKRIEDKIPTNYLIGYRGVTDSVSERTCIASFLPKVGCDTSCRNIFSSMPNRILVCLLGNINSLIFDYFVRQKLIGLNLTSGTFEQLPVLNPDKYNSEYLKLIVPIIYELSYSSWDIKPFADDVWKEADADLKEAITKQFDENKATTGGHEWAPPEWCEIDEAGCPLPPFKWDESRRAVLKAELDAIYAKLYGLTTEELRYILDPQDVYGADFPGETFRVLKEKEIRNFGEYRTRRLVLEAWERLNKNEN